MRWIYLAVTILVAAARSYSRCRISRSSPCPFSDLVPICHSRCWSALSWLRRRAAACSRCSIIPSVET